MKKLFLIAFFSMLLAAPGFAQIKVQGESTNKTTTIASVRGRTVNLNHNTKLGYYLIFPTTNRFDDSVLISLGMTKEDTSASLASFINMYNEADGYSATFTDVHQKVITILKWGASGKGSLTFEEEGTVQAGIATIHRFEMVNLQKKFTQFCSKGNN